MRGSLPRTCKKWQAQARRGRNTYGCLFHEHSRIKKAYSTYIINGTSRSFLGWQANGGGRWTIFRCIKLVLNNDDHEKKALPCICAKAASCDESLGLALIGPVGA